MKKLIYIAFFLPILTCAQENVPDKGIHFEQNLSWPQVLAKAKAENKYIFLDCFTTWCGPCKEMDAQVYPLKTVGDAYNTQFISVKVQMDKTAFDDSLTRRWYNNAAAIQSRYGIRSFPTYLFFSPDGTPTHKVSATMSPEQFISLAKDATNPEKQYYQVVKKFQPGKIDTMELKSLVEAFEHSDKELAGKMAADYLSRIPATELSYLVNLQMMVKFQQNLQVLDISIKYIKALKMEQFAKNENIYLLRSLSKQAEVQDIVGKYIAELPSKRFGTKENISLVEEFRENPKVNERTQKYLSSLNNEQLYTMDNIVLTAAFTKSSTDPHFTIFYKNPDKVDHAVGKKGYAKQVADFIIDNDEIHEMVTAAIKDKKTPNWSGAEQRITSKYSADDAKRIVLSSKVNYYKYQTQIKNDAAWPEYLKYAISQAKSLPVDSTTLGPGSYMNTTNDVCWNVFSHSNDNDQIDGAIELMSGFLRFVSDSAPYLDTYANLLYKAGKKDSAIEWEEKAVALDPPGSSYGKYTRDVLSKMKVGIPTWLVPVNEGKKP